MLGKKLYLAGVFSGIVITLIVSSSNSLVQAATDLWVNIGGDIKNTNSGRVVIGTASSKGLGLDVKGASDASGLQNSGILEIGDSLRIDANEIITNNNSTLNFQHGNNGDLKVDGNTFLVDASANRVVIGNKTSGLKLEVKGTSDASGLPNTGILEIGDTLRIDGNEIITNNNTTLNLQNGNNGDLRIDHSGLVYDNSNNRVGIGKITPVSPLHIYQNDSAIGVSSGITLEQAGTGDTKIHFLLTNGTRWVAGVDNSDADKFKIGQGSQWGQGVSFYIKKNGDVCIGNCE